MDDNAIVKIADFGVARVIETTGHMTAETGTYRWMAPEVIEHKPYDEKADVFSFGIVLWELLTCKVRGWGPMAGIRVVQLRLEVNPMLFPLVPSYTLKDLGKIPTGSQRWTTTAVSLTGSVVPSRPVVYRCRTRT